jgi:stearoyl-CoA desaturase (delta-9 desaturase)
LQAHAIDRAPDERVNWKTSIPFFLVHVLCLAAIFTGISRTALILFVTLYVVRMFFITAGYHRYFAHKSYKLGRAMQFVMAFGGGTAAQKGPLWWAGHHRNHHRFSDTERDIHSPLKGFWWSHVGWILCDKNNELDVDVAIKDFAKYPELRWLNTHDWVPVWTLAVASFLIGGWSGLVVGFLWSTVLLWHGTFTVNSLAHVMGRRRFATSDTSRNSALIAAITLGEGWHNNHHHYQASARQGFYWWEFDVSYYVLRSLSFVGLVKDLKLPPARVLRSDRVRDGAFDEGMFKKHWAKAHAALAAARHHGAEADTAPTLAGATRTADGAADLDAEHHTRREQLEDKIRSNRAALEEYVASSLRSAEELARLDRRAQRTPASAD